MRPFLSYTIPGIMLLFLAFFAGSQRSAALGLFGFLAFFVAGVTMICEGARKKRFFSNRGNKEKRAE